MIHGIVGIVCERIDRGEAGIVFGTVEEEREQPGKKQVAHGRKAQHEQASRRGLFTGIELSTGSHVDEP